MLNGQLFGTTRVVRGGCIQGTCHVPMGTVLFQICRAAGGRAKNLE